MSDWLTSQEAADLLRITPSELRRLRRLGRFKKGVHYTTPPGMHPRWKRAALMQHLTGGAAKPYRADSFVSREEKVNFGGLT